MITPEDAEIILEAIDSALIDVHTSLPCIVTKYDDTKKTVELEIQTKRILEKENGGIIAEELPPLTNVPVCFQGSSTYALAFGLSEGDEGLVTFSETSMDQWRSKGHVTSPSDVERHGLSGGIFIPCPMSLTKVISDAVSSGAMFGCIGGAQLRATGSAMEVTSGGAGTAADFVAMAAKVDDFISRFDTVMTSWVPAPPDGGLALQVAYKLMFGHLPPVPALNPQPTGSTNLKAD